MSPRVVEASSPLRFRAYMRSMRRIPDSAKDRDITQALFRVVLSVSMVSSSPALQAGKLDLLAVQKSGQHKEYKSESINR